MSAYEMMYRKYVPKLSDPNVLYIKSEEYRDVYIKTIQNNIKDVFTIGNIEKLEFSPEKWEVNINKEPFEIKDNFLAIGSTRDIGDRKDSSFFQIKHKLGELPDISRVHCVIYFYEEFVVVVDLWSYNGTDVVLGEKVITSQRNNRNIMKIINNGFVVLRNCISAPSIFINKKSNISENKSKCVICMTNDCSHVISPCGHKCLCYECTKNHTNKILKCPMCRTDVTNIMNVFE